MLRDAARAAAHPPKELYQFGLTPRSERLPIASGGSWVFFSGMFSGGGSGMLERVAILRYGANGKIENLMPEVTQTELADRAMWKVPDVSSYPVFVRADYVGQGRKSFRSAPLRRRCVGVRSRYQSVQEAVVLPDDQTL